MRAIWLTLLLTAAASDLALAGQPVLVATRAIQRGGLITMGDVLVVERDAAPADALSDPAQALGRVATRGFGYGTVIRAGGLVLPVIARRGDPVTIAAEAPGVRVEAAGVARADGREGTTVAAENAGSGKPVRGTLSANGTVTVPR